MKNIDKIAKYVMYALLVISCIVVGLSFNEGNEGAMAENSATEMAINWAIGLAGLGIILAIVAEVVAVAQDPKLLVKSGIALVAVAAVSGIFWAMADGSAMTLAGGNLYDDELTLKLADVGLFSFYLCVGGALVSILATEIYQMFK